MSLEQKMIENCPFFSCSLPSNRRRRAVDANQVVNADFDVALTNTTDPNTAVEAVANSTTTDALANADGVSDVVVSENPAEIVAGKIIPLSS